MNSRMFVVGLLVALVICANLPTSDGKGDRRRRRRSLTNNKFKKSAVVPKMKANTDFDELINHLKALNEDNDSPHPPSYCHTMNSRMFVVGLLVALMICANLPISDGLPNIRRREYRRRRSLTNNKFKKSAVVPKIKTNTDFDELINHLKALNEDNDSPHPPSYCYTMNSRMFVVGLLVALVICANLPTSDGLPNDTRRRRRSLTNNKFKKSAVVPKMKANTDFDELINDLKALNEDNDRCASPFVHYSNPKIETPSLIQ
ncbi:predicted protein [Nematostella vectensis]|uniref:Uncharacterized protein n=1 Tax=Nematostella vectensis TaxID=45351 RepID=A7SJ55_NEMVE|nr:predicted protein [Nematostella vectensis]|eukprot:XP_001628346.1 predicted protein [Nematostella vectensis]